MARSVSYPARCHVVCFRDVSHIQDDGEWSDYVDDLRDTVCQTWPSLASCRTWLDREDCAIAHNDHCWIGVSVYCGLAAVWLCAKPDIPRLSRVDAPEQLSHQWCALIEPAFRKMFDELQLVATASNGEAFYRKIE